MTKPSNKNKAKKVAAAKVKAKTKRLKAEKEEADLKFAAEAKAKAMAATVSNFIDPTLKPSATPTGINILSPRKTQAKIADVSTPTSKSDTSIVSQGKKQKQKIDNPPNLNNISKTAKFDDATKELVVVQEPIQPVLPYTSQDYFEDSKHKRLITDDSRFVMESVDLALSKDACNKFVILQIISDKIEELLQLNSVAIEDDPNSDRFLNIILNFKLSQIGKYFMLSQVLGKNGTLT